MLHLGPKGTGCAAIAALAACMAVSTAQAAVITETAPFNSPIITDSGVDIFVPQFDPALGTLTGVSTSLTGQFTPRVSFDQAPPPSLSPVQFNPVVNLAAVFQGFNVYDIRIKQSLEAEFAPIESNQTAVGTPDAVDITAALPLTGTSVSYAGPGNLDFYVTGASGVSSSYGRYVVNDQAGLTGQLAVTYTYTPGIAVPEPASLALLGAGLLGLCAVRFRGRNSAST